MNDTNKLEAAGATAAGAASIFADVEPILHFLITIATLAWWIRLWLKNPNLPPPGGKAAGVPVLLLAGALAGSGCASMKVEILETKDGTKHTTVRARTLFDAKSELAKLRTTATDKTQGVTLSGLVQESNGSNVVSLVESAVSAAVSAAVKAAKPSP